MQNNAILDYHFVELKKKIPWITFCFYFWFIYPYFHVLLQSSPEPCSLHPLFGTVLTSTWSNASSSVCPDGGLPQRKPGPGQRMRISETISTYHHNHCLLSQCRCRVLTGVLNFRASLYRDQFQFFGPC